MTDKEFGVWQPIETAPKDGTKFIAKIGNAIYAAYYKDDQFIWIMHANKAPGRIYSKKTIGGIEYQQEIRPEAERDYQPEGKIWMKGFKDKPSHWMPLPKPPVQQQNSEER